MIRRLILLLTLFVTLVPGMVSADRDPLAPVVDMPQPPIATVPEDLLTQDQQAQITGVIHEAREFGVPLVVRAFTIPTSPALLTTVSPIVDAAPSGQTITQHLANQWLATEVIETSAGAEDGILLLVVVPEDDHTRTTAAFAYGANALPLNGLTTQGVDQILNDVMLPIFRSGTIGNGIATGIAYLSYDNLFARPARLQRTSQQETLFDVTNIGLFGLTLLSSAGLVGLAIWIHRRNTRRGPEKTTTLEVGALIRGRVDETVSTAAVLHLTQLGAMHPFHDRNGTPVLRIVPSVHVSDPFAKSVYETLEAESDEHYVLRSEAYRRMQDISRLSRHELQDELATRGLLNRDAKIETTWLVLGSTLLAVIALMALIPSMMSLSRIGLAGILIATLVIIGVLVWAAQRSWITPTGQDALAAWHADDHPEAERMIVDSIINQDILLDSPGGPGVPSATRLVRDLRTLGAG